MRVCTYNISGAINQDNRFYSKRGSAETADMTLRARASLEEIALFMAVERVDVLALQEADVCYNGGEVLDQAAYLGAALDMHVAFQPSFDYHLGRRTNVTTGLATLSRGAIRSSDELRFRNKHLSLKGRVKAKILGAKKAQHVELDTELGPLHLVNAHLTHNNDRQKELELRTLLDYCAEHDPVLLVGDLNTTPLSTRGADMVEPEHFATDRCMQLLAEHAAELGDRMRWDSRLTFDDEPTDDAVLTYPSDGPTIKLDYVILFSQDPALRLGAERVLDCQVSNHAGVIAEVSRV